VHRLLAHFLARKQAEAFDEQGTEEQPQVVRRPGQARRGCVDVEPLVVNKYQAELFIVLVPDFVIALILPPVKLLYCTLYGASITFISSKALIEMGGVLVCPPFVPLKAIPRISLLFAPSIKKALNLLFCPASDIRPSPFTFDCGTNLIKSCKLRLIDGTYFR
jgi:hypothetical protein